jgi:hypothetical protein
MQARYAEQLVQLQCQQELRKQKDGLSLLQRGARGADMHAEGSDAKREEQLQRACVKLEHKLGISLGAPLPISACCKLVVHLAWHPRALTRAP